MGDITISARLGTVDDNGPMIILKVDAPPSVGSIFLRTKYGYEGIKGPWPTRIRTVAKPEFDGSFVLDGTVAHGPGSEPNGAEVPFKLVMKL